MLSFNILLENNLRLNDQLLQMARALASGSTEAKEAEVNIAESVTDLARYYSPWITGSLASSHTVFANNTETYVTINPLAINPWSDENPPEYGPKVHAMGGYSTSGHERAFYDALVRDESDQLLDQLSDTFIATLKVFK